MRQRVQKISATLSERLSGWKEVDSITAMKAADEDLTSPYFFISLDVYYRGDIPPAETRQKLFSDAGAFESSSHGKKDRFFMDDIPVRIEFKDMERINHILNINPDNFWTFRATGTYMFYRIMNGRVLFQKSPWLNQVREKLAEIPEHFWTLLINSCLTTMEHYLVDVKSSAVLGDQLFYTLSLSGFLKSFISLMFAINHTFEPSSRNLKSQMDSLSLTPEHFKSRFGILFSDQEEMSPERKAEICELLARSVIPFIK